MRKSLKIFVPIAIVAAVAVGGGLWWFFQEDAPAEVSLDAATAGLDDEDDEPEGSTDDTVVDEPAVEGIEGTWSVDTETGDFDYESATGTFVGFRVQEELSNIGSTTAVGRTGGVTGTMTIEGTTVTAASFEIDATTITTNDSRRDDKVQQALETDQFPTLTFTLTQPIELGASAEAGDPVSATAIGELTVHGVTLPAEFTLEAQLVDDTVVVVGSTGVVFSDFGVEVPSSRIVLSVEDHGTLELQLLLTRG